MKCQKCEMPMWGRRCKWCQWTDPAIPSKSNEYVPTPFTKPSISVVEKNLSAVYELLGKKRRNVQGAK